MCETQPDQFLQSVLSSSGVLRPGDVLQQVQGFILRGLSSVGHAWKTSKGRRAGCILIRPPPPRLSSSRPLTVPESIQQIISSCLHQPAHSLRLYLELIRWTVRHVTATLRLPGDKETRLDLFFFLVFLGFRHLQQLVAAGP